MNNIKTVSKILGIPTSTIRTWEQRYHIINPVRTQSGHRLYSDQDIADLSWIKQQIEHKGMTISQAVHLLKQKRHEGPLWFQLEERETKLVQGRFQAIIEQSYDSFVNLDMYRAQNILDYCFSMFHYEEVFDEILIPILTKLGDEWRSKNIYAAQEHFTCNLISQRFHNLFRLFPVYHSLPRMMAFCPLGEHHQIGLLRFTLFLRKHGVDVIYIGANNPYEGIKKLISKHSIKIIALSLSNPKLVPFINVMIEDILKDFPEMKFALGGRAFRIQKDTLREWILPSEPHSWVEWLERVLYHST